MKKSIPSVAIILLISTGIGFFIASSSDSLHVFEINNSEYTVQLLTNFFDRLPLSLLASFLIVCAGIMASSLIARLFVRDNPKQLVLRDIPTLLPLAVTLLIPLRYIDGLGQAYPYLFLISGTLMPALLSVALILSLYLKLVEFGLPWLHGREQGRLLPRFTSSSIAVGVFILLSIFYLITAPIFADNSIFGGDQPHYLVVTHSLFEDGDIYIEDEHADGVVDEFTPIQTEPQFFQRTVDNKIIPFHRIGLPVMAVIPYWIAGKTGVIVFMGLLSALSAALVFLLTDKIVQNRRAALWTTAFVSLTTPVFLLSYQFFSEVPAATITLLVLNMIIRSDENRGPMLPWLIPFLVWTLPWMHARDMITALALTAFLVVRMRSGLFGRAGILMISLVLAMGIPLFNYMFYGTFSLVAEMGGDKTAFGFMNIVRGFGGMFFDQEFGMLLYNPGLILVFPGLLSLLHKRFNIAVWLIIIAGFSVGPNILYRMWWGGGSAPGRYYVAVLHLAAIPLAKLLAYNQRYHIRRLFVVLCLIGIVFAGFLLVENQHMVNDRDGTARALTAVSAHTIDVVEWLPSWFSDLNRSWILAGVITTFAILTSLLILLLGKLFPLARLDNGYGVLLALTIILIVAGIYAPLAESITPDEPNQFQPTSHELDQLYLQRIRGGKFHRVDVSGNNSENALPAIRRSAEYIYGSRNLEADEKASRNRSKLILDSEIIPVYDEAQPLWQGEYTVEFGLRSVDSGGTMEIRIENLGEAASAEPLLLKTVDLTDQFQNFLFSFNLVTNCPGLLVTLTSTTQSRFQHLIIQPIALTTLENWTLPVRSFNRFFWRPAGYFLVTKELELFRPETSRFWTWGDYLGSWLIVSPTEFNTINIDVHSKPGVELTLESNNDGVLINFTTMRRHKLPLKPVVEKRGHYWVAELNIQVDGHFIPAETDSDSTDTRELGVSVKLDLSKE